MRWLVSLLGLALVIACSEERTTPAPPAPVERAAAAVARLKQGLVSELTAAIAAGGPENALEVCRVRAPELARAAAEPGLAIGRTSHKLRNPANAGPAWVAPLLA